MTLILVNQLLDEVLAAEQGRFVFVSSEAHKRTPYVATNPALIGVRGYYFVDCSPAEGSAALTDDEMAACLWEVSVELTRDYLLVQSLQA